MAPSPTADKPTADLDKVYDEITRWGTSRDDGTDGPPCPATGQEQASHPLDDPKPAAATVAVP